MPRNIDELKQFMTEEWDAIPETTIQNLISAMRKVSLFWRKTGIEFRIKIYIYNKACDKLSKKFEIV